MSSLMQHHGGRSVDGRKVELLMYLEHYEEEPCKCMNCGRLVVMPMEQVTKCECGKLTGDVFWRSSESEDQIHWKMWEHWPEEINEQCRNGKLSHQYAANQWTRKDTEIVQLHRPDGTVANVNKLYRIYRRPVGMWGCWVQFRYNGKTNVPDLSVPISTLKLPRDAQPLTDEEASAYWFSNQ